MTTLEKFRRTLLFMLLAFVLLLFAIDRTAAYLYVPDEDATGLVIYTTQTCPYCRQLRKYLDEHHYVYLDRDINTVEGGMGFWALRGRGVPVSVIGPEVIYGFDLKVIQDALTKHGIEPQAR